MKLSTVVPLFGYAFAAAGNLVPRQVQCSKDNCFRAVWRTSRGTDHPLTALRDCMSRLTTTVAIFPVTTITVVARNTTTAVVSCSTTPTSSTTSSLTTSASSLPEFTFPTPIATSEGAAVLVKARQNEVLSSSTTTIIGPIPTYAGDNCFNSGSVYASICSCKGVTQDTLTKLSTTLTSMDTLTLTSTVTSTASCSMSLTVTMSHSSSTVITTVTMISSTGTGTVSVPSISSSSSSSITGTATTSSTSVSTSSTAFNTTTTPAMTWSTSSATLNTTSTSSTTSTSPTPSCPGLGEIPCNGTCLDARTDRLNCGSCGNVCAPDQDCVNGVCARQPCDSTCSFNRFCNTEGNGRPAGGCICATDTSDHGICFDKDRYQCGNGNLVRCLQTELSNEPSDMGCPLGHVCIKSICASNCNNTNIPEAAQMGICVSTERCGNSGTTQLGPLVQIRNQEKRRRLVDEFNW